MVTSLVIVLPGLVAVTVEGAVIVYPGSVTVSPGIVTVEAVTVYVMVEVATPAVGQLE